MLSYGDNGILMFEYGLNMSVLSLCYPLSAQAVNLGAKSQFLCAQPPKLAGWLCKVDFEHKPRYNFVVIVVLSALESSWNVDVFENKDGSNRTIITIFISKILYVHLV